MDDELDGIANPPPAYRPTLTDEEFDTKTRDGLAISAQTPVPTGQVQFETWNDATYYANASSYASDNAASSSSSFAPPASSSSSSPLTTMPSAPMRSSLAGRPRDLPAIPQPQSQLNRYQSKRERRPLGARSIPQVTDGRVLKAAERFLTSAPLWPASQANVEPHSTYYHDHESPFNVHRDATTTAFAATAMGVPHDSPAAQSADPQTSHIHHMSAVAESQISNPSPTDIYPSRGSSGGDVSDEEALPAFAPVAPLVDSHLQEALAQLQAFSLRRPSSEIQSIATPDQSHEAIPTQLQLTASPVPTLTSLPTSPLNQSQFPSASNPYPTANPDAGFNGAPSSLSSLPSPDGVRSTSSAPATQEYFDPLTGHISENESIDARQTPAHYRHSAPPLAVPAPVHNTVAPEPSSVSPPHASASNRMRIPPAGAGRYQSSAPTIRVDPRTAYMTRGIGGTVIPQAEAPSSFYACVYTLFRLKILC